MLAIVTKMSELSQLWCWLKWGDKIEYWKRFKCIIDYSVYLNFLTCCSPIFFPHKTVRPQGRNCVFFLLVFQCPAKHPADAFNKHLLKKKNMQKKEKALFFREVVRAKWMILKSFDIMVRAFMAILLDGFVSFQESISLLQSITWLTVGLRA